MNNELRITINANRVEAANIWALLKRIVEKKYAIFQIHVPLSMACEIFGEWKPVDVSWEEYVLANIRECGTFVVDGYIQRITELENEKRGPFEWVLVKIEKVREVSEGIYVIGLAEEFQRNMGFPVLRSLK